jgi:hypothetical protein
MRRFLFADEAGDFNFSRKANVSRYFIVCAVSLDSCEIGHQLLRLRRDMQWDGFPLDDQFHATEDKQIVRERVFDLLSRSEFEIYAQILEKAKAQPKIRPNEVRFYQHAWFYLLRHSMPRIVKSIEDQLMVTAASIGTKKTQAAFSDAVRDVVQQTQRLDAGSWRTSFTSAVSDPCLQVADYCTWAIQRKWERNDTRSYDLIKSKIKYEYDTWQKGKTLYY